MHEGSVVGIDVGCSSTRRSSAICRLDWSANAIAWEIIRFRAIEPERRSAIAQASGGRKVAAAAFDGPIRRGFGVIGRYRTAERMLTRRLQPLIGKPGQSNSPVGRLLNLHANECVHSLVAVADVQAARHPVAIDSKALVEAFPSSFLGVMIPDPARLAARRSNRSDVFFRYVAEAGFLERMIGHCLPNRELKGRIAAITNHDDRAAFICAVTALCVAVDDFIAVGDEDGWIILPPERLIQTEQLSLLIENASEEPPGVLYFSTRRTDFDLVDR